MSLPNKYLIIVCLSIYRFIYLFLFIFIYFSIDELRIIFIIIFVYPQLELEHLSSIYVSILRSTRIDYWWFVIKWLHSNGSPRSAEKLISFAYGMKWNENKSYCNVSHSKSRKDVRRCSHWKLGSRVVWEEEARGEGVNYISHNIQIIQMLLPRGSWQPPRYRALTVGL